MLFLLPDVKCQVFPDNFCGKPKSKLINRNSLMINQAVVVEFHIAEPLSLALSLATQYL
jgi:hypothetical protein